jgi:hypothetical protein
MQRRLLGLQVRSMPWLPIRRVFGEAFRGRQSNWSIRSLGITSNSVPAATVRLCFSLRSKPGQSFRRSSVASYDWELSASNRRLCNTRQFFLTYRYWSRSRARSISLAA